MTADQNAGDGEVYYAISTDDRTTWTVIDNTDGERDIVRNNAGTWQYNSNGTYASETWVNGATNTELATLAEAMEGAADVINAFDVSTASLSETFSVASQATSPNGVAFNTSGSKMFVVDYTGQDVNEYTLSTAFDVSTASFVDNFNLSSQDTNIQDITFNTDGTLMFISGITNTSIYKYILSTAFDVSTATYSQSFSVSSQSSSPTGVFLNSSGTKMFVIDYAGVVNEYALSTGFDLSTATYSQNFSVSAKEPQAQGLAFNTDGTKMFVVGDSSDSVHEYALSTSFDISTASFSQSFSVASQDALPRGLCFNPLGSKMFIVGNANDSVYGYTVGATSYPNQMDKTQLDAVTDPNHIALGNDLDLAIVFNMTSGSTVPSSDGVAINYDANVLNKGAVLGTDYDFDAPAQDKVRITALAGNNLKVRVV
jgi:sugar lactone lactonase YvrE